MERRFFERDPEQSTRRQDLEKARQDLGFRALVCESCRREQPQKKGYVKMPVKVRAQGEVRPSRPAVIEEPVMILDAPSRKLASEANNAEKKARLDADLNFYREIARRRAESR